MPSITPFTPPPTFTIFGQSNPWSTTKSSDASGVGYDSVSSTLSEHFTGCNDSPDIFSEISSSELDPAEKLKLLKKARKLSKVFGDMPSYDAITSGNPKNPNRNMDHLSSDFNTHISIAGCPDRRPSQPCSQSLPHIYTYPEPVPPSPTISRGDLTSHKGLPLSDILPSLLRNHGPMSSPALQTTPSLLSHLGPSSKVAEQPIASPTSDEPSPVTTPSRRKSMGVSSLLVSPTEVHPPSPVSPSSLKRSQSLSQRPVRRSIDSTMSRREFQRRYYLNFWGDGEATQKQRFINVRRARKMAQIFGQEPPTELILPQQIRSSSSPEPPLVTEFIVDEDSLTQVCEFRDLSPNPMDPPSTFHQRQRRVVKLTRFFGVDYQDISPSVAPMPSSPQREAVDVKVGRKRFWNFGTPQNELKEANMDEIIGQLRGLKAT
ncbi:hypothetical protein BDN72DRAFT_19015 [Pluteus cervinus]|uniref:Uncharacterized protein n=1 Tax=Pluteus cervinus TaxID=181527 RepID=A0ACD3BGC1_9AGAR|nr:hypothetical protein BDN72DRAFT_19015 [Pluteus cervinus]